MWKLIPRCEGYTELVHLCAEAGLPMRWSTPAGAFITPARERWQWADFYTSEAGRIIVWLGEDKELPASLFDDKLDKHYPGWRD